MEILFRNYNDSYYNTVCDFLIELSKDDYKHVNWNWARWEWMVFHPEFDNDLTDKIGLWFCNEQLVGMTTYDHYFGEAFFAVKSGFEELEKDIVKYAIDTFSDENGLGIAVNDDDIKDIDLLNSYGFIKNDNVENILKCTFENFNFNYILPKDISIKNLDIKNDLYKHNKVLWKGFNHGEDVAEDDVTISKQKRMLSAKNLNSYIHIVAENEEGEYVAYCGCWYNPKTDYVYIEPVCTIPEYRKRGIGKAVVLEALKRSCSLGGKKAYVISDNDFYKSLGFSQYTHYTFYWHNS